MQIHSVGIDPDKTTFYLVSDINGQPIFYSDERKGSNQRTDADDSVSLGQSVGKPGPELRQL
jgi:hypothetical protein